MPDINIKRGYEILPDNNVRFGIKITNNTDSAISDVEVILDYATSLFDLEGDKIQNLGNIPPNISRTAKFILKPKGCVHKENIEATIQLRDHKWEKHVINMRPKVVHCVCPFLKEKHMTRAEFFDLSKSGYTAESGLNFHGIGADQLTSFLEQACKNRQYKVDEYSIEGGKMLLLASESIGEKAIYLLNAYIRENEGLAQVMLRAVSDKPHGLNGFLSEIMDGLRHIVSTVQSAWEIGVIKKEQVINIIDSVVQQTTFAGGEGAPEINIEGSVVQRTEFKGDDEKKRLEEERKKQDEQVRLKKLKEEEERLRKEKEEFEQKRKEEEERRRLKEQERLIKIKEEEETKKQEEQERLKKLQAEEERINKEKEKLEQKRKEEDKRKRHKGKDKKDNILPIKFLTLILVLSILVIGYWVSLQWNNESETLDSLQSITSETTINRTEGDNLTAFAEITENFTNSIGMEFVLIPAGEFEMGSPKSDWEFVHDVKIENAYYMGKFEVTQKQWREVMGEYPDRLSNVGDNRPVEWVSWNDVQEFINKLNEKEGTIRYRLPSEAEWEYAARAGTNTTYFFGEDELKLDDYAWYRKYPTNLDIMYHNIGQKKPNSWGLYDIYGNVGEWVQDDWHSSYEDAPTDGSAWESGYGFARIIRGGGYGSGAGECTSAHRSRIPNGSTARYQDFGFRLVMDLPYSEDNTNAVISPEVNQTIYQTSDTALTTAKNFTNSIGMEFVLIPPGDFNMGSPLDEIGRNYDEGPIHTVEIEKPYYIGKYEVTQKQWYTIMGTNPSEFKGDNFPVESVSWNEVQEFIDKLNLKEGTVKYRLPSEAEWEYIARAGTTTRYSFGDEESKLNEYAWYSGYSGSTTHTVGLKNPNQWGLYDIYGNVWEWVQDERHDSYYGAPLDGSAWESGENYIKVYRGGSWGSNANCCRSASRDRLNSEYPSHYGGFRLLKEV